MMANNSVFIVEDQNIIALDLKLRLKKLGYRISGIAASGEEALAGINNSHPDVVLMDIILRGDMDGIETAKKICEQNKTPVIFLTSHSDKETKSRALKTHPRGYLLKPVNETELKHSIDKAILRNKKDIN